MRGPVMVNIVLTSGVEAAADGVRIGFNGTFDDGKSQACAFCLGL